MTANDPFHPTPRRRALIADDDDSLRRYLRVLLEDAGYVVEDVADGAAALARLRVAPPDLLVSDVLMPSLDGFSLCRAIRADPQLAHLPVLLASASYQAPHDERLAHAAGASAFLRKPASIEEWRTALRSALAAAPITPAPEREYTALHAEVLGTQLTRKLGELDEQRVQLRASEARFRDVFDQVNDCLFIIEPGSGRILDANRRACELLGLIESGDEWARTTPSCPCAELLSLTVAEIGPPEEAEATQRAVREISAKGHLLFERHLRRRDGSLVPCEVSARHTVQDGRDVIVSVVRDITERKQAEQMLQDSEERFRATFEQAAVGIAQVGPDGRWLHVNQKLCDIVGYSRAELLQSTFQDITYPEDLDADLAFVQRILAGEIQTYSMEKRYVRKDRSLVWIYLTVGLVRQPTGEAKYFISVVEDISERKQAEEALRENALQLQMLSKHVIEAQEIERRRLAHELHDELGQALTAIKINLQARGRFKGQSPEVLDAENIRIVDDALQQVRRLALALRPSMLDDLGLGSALRWMADQQAERSGFVVHFGADFPDTRLAPELETVCFRIAQEALTNIARHAQAKRVVIELRHAGDVLVMTMQDDGCGFDVAAMRARATAGVSIGLLGMQERATLAGGSLDIESSPRRGTILRARFPWRTREEQL